jgi:hypothetical protein
LLLDAGKIARDEDLSRPGTLRSGETWTRPARSRGASSNRPSGEAATPAAHNTVRDATNVSPSR